MKSFSAKIETYKNVMQIIALIVLTGYFLYRNKTGWMEISMSLDVETERVSDPNSKKEDIIAVKVNLKNGNYGSIRLTDGIVAFSYDENTKNKPVIKRLDGLDRYDTKDWKVNHGIIHEKLSMSGLGPEQEIELSTYINIPKYAVCIIDVTILAKRLKLDFHPNESRSTVISLPLPEDD